MNIGIGTSKKAARLFKKKTGRWKGLVLWGEPGGIPVSGAAAHLPTLDLPHRDGDLGSAGISGDSSGHTVCLCNESPRGEGGLKDTAAPAGPTFLVK